MNKLISIKKSNEQLTHTTKTTFLSIDNHIKNFNDCIKIHTPNKDGGNLIHEGIVNKIENLIEKDSLIEQLLLHLESEKQTELINKLINKIKEL
jgi:hypothetical protein